VKPLLIFRKNLGHYERLSGFGFASLASATWVAALEFAILAPVFFLVLLGCLEIGFMLMADAALERAANHVTRKARIEYRGSCSSVVKSELNKHLGGWAKAETVSAQVLHSHDEGAGNGSGGVAGRGLWQKYNVYKRYAGFG